jgi:hypothetical protein
MVLVALLLVCRAPGPACAGTIRVDSTGITIPTGRYPHVEDLIIPDAGQSPFFNEVLTGVRDGLLSRETPAPTHINFDGSGVFMDGVTGSLGTFTWTIDNPAGAYQFVDVSSLPPEPFPPAGFLRSVEGTLASVSGPGFTTDPLVGTTGWHTKIVLTGPFVIPGGTPLTELPDGVFTSAAWHASMDAIVSFHSSSPEPSSLCLCGFGLLTVLGGVWQRNRGRRKGDPGPGRHSG